MPWNSRPSRRLPTADQYANRGGLRQLDVETTESSGSPRSVPSMKAGKTGGFTSKTRFGTPATNPAGVGAGSGKGGYGSAKGA